jgi:NADH-quinone oxidoreductase subunit C
MTDDTLTAALAGLFDSAHNSHGMCVLELQASQLLPAVQRLHQELGFRLLLDVTAVDHLARQPRFDVVYHLLNVQQKTRVRLKVQVSEENPEVPTLTTLFGSARFLERETHEMYGIKFQGNGDLRPILLYEGFVGHPLRKDYPMEREQPIVPYRK